MKTIFHKSLARNPFALFLSASALFFALQQADAIIDINLQMQLGNPTGATASTNDPNHHLHYLIQRPQYALDYSDTNRQPNWVSWDLTSADVGSSGRTEAWAVDTSLPSDFHPVPTSTFGSVNGQTYDRGHMCPSADRTDTVADNEATFIMSNIIPQASQNNQGLWATFEGYSRSLISAQELLIISGPSNFGTDRIASGGHGAIASNVWKIVVCVPLGADTALSRLTNANPSSIRVIAIQTPNNSSVSGHSWTEYITSVKQVQQDTGYNFFSALPNNLAWVLRSKVDGQAAAAPSFGSFSPSSGSQSNSVTISGGVLDTITNVDFNGTAASYTITATNQIIALVPVGASSGQITVRGLGGNATSVSSFTVTPAVIPDFTITPTDAFTSGGNQGGPFSPSSQIYTLNNTNTTSLSWGVGKNASWLDLSATSGTLAGGASMDITASVNSAANSLAGGGYSDTVTFSNATTGAWVARSVNLTVLTLGQLSVSPVTTFTATGQVGGPFSPSSQDYTLSNTGSVSLNWTAGATATWLDLSAVGGTLAGGSSTNVTVSINANANSLSVGSYSDAVSFVNQTSGIGDTTRPVSLTVNDLSGQLSVSPASGFSAAGQTGGPFGPTSQTYALTNSGGMSLNWTASNAANWLTLSATSGALAAGASTNVTASINANANSLSVGAYSDTIGFTNTTNGDGDTTRAVSLNVSSFGFYDDFSAFAAGNLVGQHSWAQALASSSLPLQVSGGKVVIPYGQTADNQDASKNFTQTSGTVFYGLTLTVSNAINSASPSYFAALWTSSNATGFANFRLSAKAGDAANTNCLLGVRVTGQSGDPYTFGTAGLSYGTQYRVIVQALAGGAGGTNAILYVNPTSSDLGAQTQYANNPVQGGTPPPTVSSLAISQYGTATFLSDGTSIGKVVVADNFATVYNDLLDAQPPVASFNGSPTSGTEPLNVNFTDTSSTTGSVTSWRWIFGDDTTNTFTTPTNPSHTYAAGTYTVQLILTGSSGVSTNIQSNYIGVLTAFQNWQNRYFGGTNCTLCGGNADFDGDGMSNTDEFLAGTDPTNSASAFRIVGVTQEGNDVRVTWATAVGHTNIVQVTSGGADGSYSTNNFADIPDSQTIVTGSGDAITNYLDLSAATNAPARYYSVRLVP